MSIYQCSVTFIDTYLRKTTRAIEIDAASDAAAKVLLDAVVSALADISDAKVVKASITRNYDVTDAETALSNIDAGMSARLILDTDPTRYASFNVPAPKADIVDADGDLIVDHTDVVAFETALKATGVKVAHQSVLSIESGKLDR